jgi:hypothetical protein
MFFLGFYKHLNANSVFWQVAKITWPICRPISWLKYWLYIESNKEKASYGEIRQSCFKNTPKTLV